MGSLGDFCDELQAKLGGRTIVQGCILCAELRGFKGSGCLMTQDVSMNEKMHWMIDGIVDAEAIDANEWAD